MAARWIGPGLLLLAAPVLAGAGELVFRDGTRLGGDLADETLLLSTASGTVEVGPADVLLLTPEEVRLRDGRVLRGTLVGGRIRARTTLGELPLRVDELTSFRAEGPPAAAGGPTGPAPAVPAAASAGGATPSAATFVPYGATLPPAAPSSSPSVATPDPAGTPPTGGGAPATAGQAGGSTGIAEGARATGQGVGAVVQGVGRAVTDGADRLHDGFKAFGLGVWDAMRAFGRGVRDVFEGS